MSTTKIALIMRLLVAGICASGAVVLAYYGKDGWGWLIFATLLLGMVTVEEV